MKKKREYASNRGKVLDETNGEVIETGDELFAMMIQAVLAALSVDGVILRRRIFDRNGARPLATIEYTPAAFAAKLGDGFAQEYEGYFSPLEERGAGYAGLA